MKLLLNTESIKYPLTGIGNYTLSLLTEFLHFSELEDIHCNNGRGWEPASLGLFVGAEEIRVGNTRAALKQELLLRAREYIRSVPYAYKVRSYFHSRRFRSIPNGSAIYHEPNFILKPLEIASVVTVHDLSFLKHPEYHPAERVKWLTSNIGKTLSTAENVIVDSDAVRVEILERYNLHPDRVHSIHLGVDGTFFRPICMNQRGSVLSKLGLKDKKYVLFIGTLEPRKGIDKLLAAWKALPNRITQEYTLVLSGANGWKNSVLLRQIHALESSGLVKFLHYVPKSYLPSLYSGAACFVFPSVYEGFGLPVLEAMSCGCPVIIGKGTAMEEFVGSAGLVLDNLGEECLSTGISSLLEDNELSNSMSFDGIQIAGRLDWRSCAQQTLAVYNSSLGRR